MTNQENYKHLARSASKTRTFLERNVVTNFMSARKLLSTLLIVGLSLGLLIGNGSAWAQTRSATQKPAAQKPATQRPTSPSTTTQPRSAPTTAPKSATSTSTTKSTAPATPGATGEKPAPKVKVSPEDKSLDELESDLNELKGEVFRSKARTSFIGEFLGSTGVEVRFNNEASEDFDLVSAYYALDKVEVFKKEYAPGTAPVGQTEELIFSGPTTPGRHEVSVILVFRGKKSGGYSDRDYEHQLQEDFSFVSVRGDITVVTVNVYDESFISQNLERTPAHYKLLLDFKAETKDLADVRSELRRRRFGVQLESGLLFDQYQIVSDRLNTNASTSKLFPIQVRGHWWFLDNWGMEGRFMTSKWSAGSDGQTTSDIDMSMMWLGLDGKFRYTFGHSIYNPTIGLKTGFHYLKLGANTANQTPVIVRLSDAYKYVEAGLEFTVPITLNFGFEGYMSYFPWIEIKENPLNSGYGARTVSWEGRGGFYYNFWRGLTLTAGYQGLKIRNQFLGRGTRTSLSGLNLNFVETQTIIHGGLLGLRYEF